MYVLKIEFPLVISRLTLCCQVVRLREVFPHGSVIVFVFEFMLSDLSEVIRKVEKPLTEAQVKSYMLMLLKGIAYCHENNIMLRVSLFNPILICCSVNKFQQYYFYRKNNTVYN